MTKTVKVAGDPRIDITFEERKAQHDALLNLQKLYSVLASANSTSNSLGNQVDGLLKTLKKIPDVPESIIETAKAISKEMKDIRLELAGDPKLGWRGFRTSVRGRLLMLRRAVGGYTGAPSQRQLQQIDKNSKQLKNLIKRINKVIEEDILKLNKLMNENKVPYLIPVEKIKISE
ncbi:MAG: hypothetical protein ACETWK_05005 [Candidatus Aminicenantaceae bacterium]